MEDKVAKQILSAFAIHDINTSHLAWMVNLNASKHIDTKLKEFFYYYHTFRNQETAENDARWMGEKMLDAMTNPIYDGLNNPPPPGTRIVFAEET